MRVARLVQRKRKGRGCRPGLRKLPLSLLERELWCNAVSSVPEAACQRSSRGDALMGLHFLPALPSARPTDACGDRL